MMWRVRVTLAAPPGGDVVAEWTRLSDALVLESPPWLPDVAVESDGDEGTVIPDATVVAGSAEQAEELLVGLVRGLTSWDVVEVTSEAIQA